MCRLMNGLGISVLLFGLSLPTQAQQTTAPQSKAPKSIAPAPKKGSPASTYAFGRLYSCKRYMECNDDSDFTKMCMDTSRDPDNTWAGTPQCSDSTCFVLCYNWQDLGSAPPS